MFTSSTFGDHFSIHPCTFYCIHKYIYKLIAVQISATTPRKKF